MQEREGSGREGHAAQVMRAYSVWSVLAGLGLLLSQLRALDLGLMPVQQAVPLLALALFHAISAIWYWQGQAIRSFAWATVWSRLLLAVAYGAVARVLWLGQPIQSVLPVMHEWVLGYVLMQGAVDGLSALFTAGCLRRVALHQGAPLPRLALRAQDVNRALFAAYMVALGTWMLADPQGFLHFFHLPLVATLSPGAAWGPVQLLAVQVIVLAALNGVAVWHRLDKLIAAGVRGGLFTCAFMLMLVSLGWLHPVVLLLPLVDFISVLMIFALRGAPHAPVRQRLQAHEGCFIGFNLGHEDGPAPRVFALGLTYADHMRETGEFAAQPLVFAKAVRPCLEPRAIVPPSISELMQVLRGLDAHLVDRLAGRSALPPLLLDYEAEIGMVLLQDWSPGKDSAMPQVGYFLANDVTVRSVQMAGLGADDPMAYWSASKSFAGFLPVTSRLWCPQQAHPDAWPDVTVSTLVNGEVRQCAPVTELLYTPQQVLAYAAAQSPDGVLRQHDVVLAGTPAGIAMQVSAWKRRLAACLPRHLAITAAWRSQKASTRFLQAGDVIDIQADWLGQLHHTVGVCS